MKKSQIVKDRQKLFKKLFISPSYSEPLDPPLLVSPDFINLLLQQSVNAPRNYQLSLIDDILNSFIQRPTNSLLLYSHDEQKFDSQKCICDHIIIRILNLIQTYQQVQLYLEKIGLMISYYRISLKNIQKLTQWLSKITYLEKFDCIKFMFIIRLLRLYYSKKIGQIKSPQHYFYIYGTQNSGIQSISPGISQLPLKNQLTVILCFNSHGAPNKLYNLFDIKTQKKQQFGLSYYHGCLKITSLSDGQYIDQFIIKKQLSEQIWYRIIINMSINQTQCIINNQIYTLKPLLKKQKQRKIIDCVFGRQFFGMISNILISTKLISLQKFDINTYPYSIDSIDHLIQLNKTNIPSNIILSCIPFFVFQIRQVLHCFDIFQRNHSTITDNVVVVSQSISQDNIDHMGGCTIILPLFYLARYYNKDQYPQMLEDMLLLILQILQVYDTQKIEMQLQKTHFIQILGEHLSDISYLQTQKSLNIIFTIYKTLKNKQLKLIFIHDLIWSLNLGIDTSPTSIQSQQQQSEFDIKNIINLKQIKKQSHKIPIQKKQSQILIKYYYKLIITLYQTQNYYAYNSMKFSQVIYWIVQHLESNQKIIYCCCLQHYLNQILFTYQTQQIIKMYTSTLQIHYHQLQDILSRYLQNFVKNNDPNQIQYFKMLLRLLLQKYSACFYLMILRVIRRQINTFDKKIIGPILASPQLQIISFLVFLSEKTINPDILSQILSLLLFVQKHTTPKKNEQIVKCIIDFLRINQDISNKTTNPIKKLIKNIRKNSAPSLNTSNTFQQENNCLNQSFAHFNRIQKKAEPNKHQLFAILKKSLKPQKLSNYEPFYNLIMNQLSNTISSDEPTIKQIKYSEQSILITREYYKLVDPLFKQRILLSLLGNLQKNSSLTNSCALSLFLLQCLKQSLYTSPDQAKSLLTIFTCIFSQVIISHGNLIDLYSSIKYLKFSRKVISLILPLIISKIIKIVDLSQIGDLMIICLYQIIQGSSQKSYQLATMVLCQFHDKILKLMNSLNKTKQVKQDDNIENAKTKIQQICQIFNKILYENTQKDIISPVLNNPFQQNSIIKQSLLQMPNQFNYSQYFQQLIQQQKNKQFSKNNQIISSFIQQQCSNQQFTQHQNKIKLSHQENQCKDSRKQSMKIQKQKNDHLQQSMMKKSTKNIQHRSKNQKKVSLNIQQLTVIQVYINLFFKIIQKAPIEKSQQNKTKLPKINKINNFTQQSHDHQISNKKLIQLNYFYDFKSKSILQLQFFQIINLLFLDTLYHHQIYQNVFIQYLISYILYKINSLKQKHSISVDCILSSLFENTILPFITEDVKNLQQIHTNIVKFNVNTIFFQFFTKAPMKFCFQDFINWRSDKQFMKISLDNIVLNRMFLHQDKYEQYLKAIQDHHDLLIVSQFKKIMQIYIDNNQKLIQNIQKQKNQQNIQKLFDIQNAAQQKTRITYLYSKQCQFRKYHFQWNYIWNKLRIYHQPYGFWMAQKFKDNIYVYPKNSIRNFKFQMSQYSSQSNLYPILQAQIIQSWKMLKNTHIKKNTYINSFSQMMKPNHNKIQKISNQSHKNPWINLWKGMINFSKKNINWNILSHYTNREKIKQYQVVLISRSTKATGKLFIQNKKYLFFFYQGAKQQDTHLSFQKFSLAFNQQTYQKWSLYSIQKIKIHRYLLRYSALQILLSQGKSIIFNFIKDNKQQFIKQIQKILKQKITINISKLYKLNKIPLSKNNFFVYQGLNHQITQKWIKRQISNLEYLILINRAASRGIYDLSQYMVVPWVVQFKKQKQPKYRDLSKTMGGLGSQQRKKIISQKYFTKDPFNPYPPFFFGTHYSSPGVVFNFLIRLSPFAEYCKHLQGGKFDIPDRLFSSFLNTWRSATQQVSDVRELIPQAYYLPQILINIDQYYFGYTQNGELINHIQLPSWGANNPYYFTSQIRQIMQSQQISEKLHEWIDLIFGYKQKGKQAEDNFNVYYYLTYEDNVNFEGDDDDDVYVKSKQAQIVHFGQIPPMIFEKPHPKRNPLPSDSIYQLKIIRSINLMTSFKQKPIGIKIDTNQLQICKRNQIQIYSIQSSPASLQKKKKINFEKSISNIYYIIKKQNSYIYFFQKNYFIIWGYLNHQFRIFNKYTGQICQCDAVNSKILTLFVNKNQDLIIVGTLSGVLYIFQIQYGLSSIFIKKVGIQTFPAPIVFISQYDGFYTITFGNYSAIYKIHRSLHYLTQNETKLSIKFFRSFYNTLPLKASFIMTSPLYTIILIDNANIKSYSINGQFIKSINSSAKYYDRFKDSQLHDVFYAIDEDKVICYSIPDLRNISILQLPEHQQVLEKYILHKTSIDEIGYCPD